MRKLLLSLACAAIATAASAQEKIEAPIKSADVMVEATDMPADRLMLKGEEAAAKTGVKKSAANGVYYQVPTGSTWSSSVRPLYAGSRPYNYVAPLTDYHYNNMSTDKTGSWTIVTPSTTIDMSKNVDENGDLWNYYYGGEGGYYGPTYTVGENSFIPTGTGGSMITYITGVTPMTFFPSAINTTETPRAFYGGGSLSTGNLYGAGTITVNEVVKTAVGISYSIPKPMSPLYVEDIKAWGNVGKKVTDEASIANPLNGKTLTMRIYNLEDETAEPVELTCTPDELVLDRAGYWQVGFTQKVKDEISGEMVANPFVIDYKAELVITGFDQEGVVLGIMGVDNADEFLLSEEEDLRNGYFICYNPETEKYNYHYYTGTVPFIIFDAMFDKVEVWTEATDEDGNVVAKINGIKVANDGATTQNVYYDANQGAFLETALDWFATDSEGNATGEELYWSDDAYDYEWIQGLTVNTLTDEDGDFVCYEVVPTCDALPEGVTKRYAKIHIVGRGCESAPIYILQGDITLEEAMAAEGETDAINNVTAVKANVNGTFNLAGQRVNKEFKGVAVKNGKKVIMK